MLKQIDYQAPICTACGQTLTWLAQIDKGAVDMLKKIALFIGNKGQNICSPTKELAHKLSSAQIANVTTLVRHGLIAHVPKREHSRGNFLLTKKGAGFLRGDPIPKYAVVQKAGNGEKSHLLGYFEPEVHTWYRL